MSTTILDKNRKKRQPFSQTEDNTLRYLVRAYGENDWGAISIQMSGRTPRQCRDRWREYLMPNLNISSWTPEEDQVLMEQIEKHGRKWSLITTCLNGRSETSVKNRWRLLERRRASSKPISSSSVDEKVPLTIMEENITKANYMFMTAVPKSTKEDLDRLFRSLSLPIQSKKIDSILNPRHLFPQLV